MSGNASNTSNARRNVQAFKTASALGMATLEALVLVEILWYYLHDGEQTLHGAIADYLRGLHERVRHRTAVDDTRRMIRNLPETDE